LFLALLVAIVTGVLLIRHKGAYFALLTLAFNALAYALATKFHNITGGDDGLIVFRPDLDLGVFEISMASTTHFYFFTLIILGAVLIYTYYFTRTAMGDTIVLLRENDERMQFIGYSTAFSRLLLFSFTGVLAGLAGAFYSLHFQFVSVQAISIDMTTTVLLMTFIGGTRTFWGPILGACIYIYFKDYLSGITDRCPLIMGAVFILMVLYAPSGLSGLVVRVKDFIDEKRQLSASKQTGRM
jgi:ABC-type branched-subunit amino acid transport system permease subunit